MAAESVEPTLVKMSRQYLDQVLAIERACFGDPWPPSAFLSELSHAWSWFKLIGRPGPSGRLDRVDGFIICWMLPLDLHLLNLAVLPERRRSGLARRMMEDALDGFMASGGGLVSLEVRPTNPAARALYERFGFVQVGVRKRYYRKDNEDAIVMMRKVDSARTSSGAL